MHRAASYLMEKETITGGEFMRMVREHGNGHEEVSQAKEPPAT